MMIQKMDPVMDFWYKMDKIMNQMNKNKTFKLKIQIRTQLYAQFKIAMSRYSMGTNKIIKMA